jgi:hypothetical protein
MDNVEVIDLVKYYKENYPKFLVYLERHLGKLIMLLKDLLNGLINFQKSLNKY